MVLFLFILVPLAELMSEKLEPNDLNIECIECIRIGPRPRDFSFYNLIFTQEKDIFSFKERIKLMFFFGC